jgi:hypothetical protein
MNLEQLLKRIEAALVKLLLTEPQFTGSMTFEINFKDGQAKDFVKTAERSRTKIGP